MALSPREGRGEAHTHAVKQFGKWAEASPKAVSHQGHLEVTRVLQSGGDGDPLVARHHMDAEEKVHRILYRNTHTHTHARTHTHVCTGCLYACMYTCTYVHTHTFVTSSLNRTTHKEHTGTI